MTVKVQLQFTTPVPQQAGVVLPLNQGTLPQSAVIGCGGPFWLPLSDSRRVGKCLHPDRSVGAKSDKETIVQRTNHLQKNK
jgi:hypothetical protein